MSTDKGTGKDAEKLPPLNALRHFEAVARLGSFAAAASDLHVTHWAVGKQIRLLEDWFGVPLFERRSRGVVPTDEGAALLNDVKGAFARLSSSVTRLRHESATRRITGVVRVNTPASFALCWLIPRLADFQVHYPDIDVRVSTTSRRLRYVGDAFDVGVRSGPEDAAGLMSTTLMPDLRLPACSPAVLQSHPIRTVADLRNHTLLHSTSTRTAWSDWLREAGSPGLQGARHLDFDHVFLQLGAASEGLGVTLASLPLIEREIAAGRLVCPISEPASRGPDYTLVLNADRADDDAVIAFKKWIMATAAHNPAAQARSGPAQKERRTAPRAKTSRR
ncbi:LysR substrate-binding domain-containing protein [Paraburkholderia saeva]|uniref:Glycine cleavage system transcriptional activator n=1 Tax=Paraburkholderia saeva TaxID=2777537 RepID=A0A9N8X4S4_9BURK|nr:LysR substrate-binding domain-containing protein [Paraburkholderia saeva]CAG4892618.1 Glycine cleavage system transcriptional activator [Paraburkholderia saeva]CAG4921029.1 Glycine cleavage system transcriptional activator [Paraburkholderia saeva]CAG4923497.1 Glycine cleavage system transcriptional activator [Paraburkholderia saeva]